MSYLTESRAALEAEVITLLADEGFAFNSKTETLPQFFARALGEPAGHLHKRPAELVAELNSLFGENGCSHLYQSYAYLLDRLDTSLEGSDDGGGDAEDEEGEEDVAIASQLFTAAQLKAAVGTEYALIPAPGAGKVVVISHGFASLIYGTATYVLNSSILQILYHGTATEAANFANLPTRTSSQFRVMTGTPIDANQDSAALANLGVDLKIAGGTGLTVGDSELLITLRYRIENLTTPMV